MVPHRISFFTTASGKMVKHMSVAFCDGKFHAEIAEIHVLSAFTYIEKWLSHRAVLHVHSEKNT